MSTEGYTQDAVIRRLSRPRFAPYERVTGDETAALALYEWNTEASAVVFHAIGMLEVLLRNSLATALSQMFPEPWYDHVDWDTKASADLSTARHRATRKGAAEVEGKVVAELTFGFWRFLLAKRYLTTLWVPGMHAAFPNLPDAVRKRTDIEDRLEHLNFLRNRVAHHEPIHRRVLLDDYAELLDLAGWMCCDTRSWIESRSLVTGMAPVPAAAMSTYPRLSVTVP